MANTQAEILARLREREDVAKAKVERIAARRRSVASKLRKKERKTENRRKLLLGAFLLSQMDVQRALGLRLKAGSPTFQDWLTRDNERALFGLPPRPNPSER